MNREDIIRMANKAYGIDEEGKPFHPSALLHLEIFAKLVAEHERERLAKVFDELDKGIGFYDPHEPAEIIRARGQA
jgi:hypothetical protein